LDLTSTVQETVGGRGNEPVAVVPRAGKGGKSRSGFQERGRTFDNDLKRRPQSPDIRHRGRCGWWPGERKKSGPRCGGPARRSLRARRLTHNLRVDNNKQTDRSRDSRAAKRSTREMGCPSKQHPERRPTGGHQCPAAWCGAGVKAVFGSGKWGGW